jgi:DNA-binding transcriptional ArsR family regulator
MAGLSDDAARILAELRHPVRLPVLLALESHPRSASELAADLDEPFDRVDYALRTLATAGLIELVGEAPSSNAGNLVRRIYASKYRGWAKLVKVLEAIAASTEPDQGG